MVVCLSSLVPRLRSGISASKKTGHYRSRSVLELARFTNSELGMGQWIYRYPLCILVRDRYMGSPLLQYLGNRRATQFKCLYNPYQSMSIYRALCQRFAFQMLQFRFSEKGEKGQEQ